MSGPFRGEPDLRRGTESGPRRFDIGMPRAQELPRSRMTNSPGVDGIIEYSHISLPRKVLGVVSPAEADLKEELWSSWFKRNMERLNPSGFRGYKNKPSGLGEGDPV